MPHGLTFVYRSHYDGPLSKRVVHLPHADILAWFREGWDAPDPHQWITQSLRGHVYGLASAFERARELGVPAPESMAALLAHLDEHLYVEGEILHDEHCIRVLTDDDEVGLAYFFFDAHAVAEHADRLAFLLHEDWPLPTDADPSRDSGFDPGFSLTELSPAGNGAGATYMVLGTFYDSDSLPGESLVIRGVRLPGLCEYLRTITPRPMPPTSWGYVGPWPLEPRLLRGLVREGETTLAPALERLRDHPIQSLGNSSTMELGIGSHADAVTGFADMAASLSPNSGDATLTKITCAEHFAAITQHVSDFFGHQQWWLFDDRWAATHPALARSLLRHGRTWDPLA
ncbi:hypothetical protein [Paraliomyxa miuraensis]|uniref:hypothetical protein n=1 Tax=Paraliomyxa miuraensis TaxID=376150 RepID=UPI00224CD55C|nr:hypothetical protein [Paraliomyxa miuraensis]MCX4244385.1 hypothetical protein [Paraliomyxa miuraensis]